MPISLDKIPPGLVTLTKTAAISLEKSGLAGQRAAVYLVLDHSGSMRPYYADGAVQRLAEQALGLSANLDDDGTVPVVFFGTDTRSPFDVSLDDYAGVIGREHPRVPWGFTNYAGAMYAVSKHYQASGASDPALVIFQTDGEPYRPGADARQDAETLLRNTSSLPIFWSFVGFGGRVDFLEKLDDLTGRKVDNASFFHAADPHRVTDADLYDGITHEFADWLAAARAAGIAR